MHDLVNDCKFECESKFGITWLSYVFISLCSSVYFGSARSFIADFFRLNAFAKLIGLLLVNFKRRLVWIRTKPSVQALNNIRSINLFEMVSLDFCHINEWAHLVIIIVVITVWITVQASFPDLVVQGIGCILHFLPFLDILWLDTSTRIQYDFRFIFGCLVKLLLSLKIQHLLDWVHRQ